MKVNVVSVQMHSKLYDVQGNLNKMDDFIQEIVGEQPDTSLIVFPELAVSGYEWGEEIRAIAETVPDGICCKTLSELAAKYHVHIVYGFPERDPNVKDVIYNSNALIDDEGQLVGVYRKVHLTAGEKPYFRPGSEYPVFDTKIGRIGMMICWDTMFPEAARILSLKGADLLTVTSAWEKPYDHGWDFATSARAFDNGIYVVASNRVGKDIEVDFLGRCRICDYEGKPMAVLNEDREGYISATVDYAEALQYRELEYAFFRDRRPDTYEEIIRG